MSSIRTAIGLMSGTSMDGIDAALIETDGETVSRFGPGLAQEYDENFRDRLRECINRPAARDDVADMIADRQADAVLKLLADNDLAASDVDVIGFHGQTVDHRPDEGVTVQIGNAQRLADKTGINVVADFRSADVAAGGQGAPLAPLYHRALAADLEKPVAVLNLGGVGNVTWIGEGPEDILAFDTGPANALIDDWMCDRRNQPMDRNGAFALTGNSAPEVLDQLMAHDYFTRQPPKSLDRMEFHASVLAALTDQTPADGARILTDFTVASVAAACTWFPLPARRWLVCGGGRHNDLMMKMLSDALGVSVEPVEAVGWRGDLLEAEAFAWLAVRSLDGKPLSLPSTTGVSQPGTGGRVFTPSS
jgi:anhydro-N-acetylmuramic acid kinase